MRDSLGGSVVVVIIVVFIVVIMGYLAFNVNYTKAFRMKNKIISVYREYDGVCNSECEAEIKKYAQTIGYRPSRRINCPKCEGMSHSYLGSDTLYCACKKTVRKTEGIHNDSGEKFYYHIVTKINIEIPIISNTIDMQVFNISGDTSVFEAK